jgi:cytochrome P450
MEFFRSIAVRLGGFVRVRLEAGRSLYLVSEPHAIKELLIDHRNQIIKMVRYSAMQRVLGDGLILSEGETWRRQRLLTQPAFKPSELLRQLAWMAPSVARYLERWRPHAASGQPIEAEAEFVRLGQLLAGILVVGPGFEQVADEVFDITEEMKANWPAKPRGILTGFIPPSKARAKRLEAAITALEEKLARRFIMQQRAQGSGEGGILSVLISGAEAEGKPFTDLELRDQVITLFYAAFETSAASMCWTQHMLSVHPAYRERMLEEIDRQLGGRMPTGEDLAKLQYTERILQESMRLYAPIHSLGRVPLEDTTVGGYTLPKGCTTVVSLYATHRLPDYWPQPEVFDPERFTPEACAARYNLAYIPFAVGHRNCIGANLAMLEGKLVLAQVAQRYVLDTVPGQRVEPMAATTLRPRNGIRMRVSERRKIPAA